MWWNWPLSHAWRQPSVPLRQVTMVPADAELGERVDLVLALSVSLLHVSMASHPGVFSGTRMNDAGFDERKGIDGVEAGELLHVLVDNAIAVRIADSLEVRLAGHSLHQDRIDELGGLEISEQVRHWEAALLHQLVKRVFVSQRKSLGIGAVAAQDQWDHLAIAFEVDEPGRTPTKLPIDAHDSTTQELLDDLRGARRGRDGAQAGFGSRGRPSARSPSRFCMIWLLPPEIVYALA